MLHKAIGAEVREVADREWDGKPAKAVVAARVYDTDPEDLWDALTNPERIPRWFSPVEGDFKLGGRYQVQGNAGGIILRCDPPQALDVTWEFGGGVTWVTVRLQAEGDATLLILEHIMLAEDMDGEHWKQYGPAAVGVGWDLSFLGLGLYLSGGQKPEDPNAWGATPEAKAFMRECAAGWAEAHIRNGEDVDTARAMAARTAAFYAPD